MFKHAIWAVGLFCVSALAFLFQPSIAFAQDPFDTPPYPRLSLAHPNNDFCPPPNSTSDTWRASQAGFKGLPSLDDFAKSVMNGQAGVVTGVYVCNVLALMVAQQPVGDPVFVSTAPQTATQFRLAANYGTIGLLAHNDRAGAQFFNLMLGQRAAIIYGDGAIRWYVLSAMRHFRTLDATNPYSIFSDLDNGGGLLSSTDVFHQVYTGSERVVFQTCIEGEGNPSWGRLFVIATPVLISMPTRQNIF